MSHTYESLQQHLKGGVIPATVTPWNPDYEIVEDDLRDHVEYLASVDGVVAIICNAHSGEGSLAPLEQKKRVIEIHQEASGDVPIFSAVAGDSTMKAAHEAQEMEAAGAEGLMIFPSEVYGQGDCPPEIVVEHYEGVAEATDLPILAFQYPQFAAPPIPIEAFPEIVTMDQVVGFKEASFDPVMYEKTLRAVDDVRDEFTMITGNDTFLYHSYFLGAETALILYANLVTERHVEKLRAVHDGDLERAREIREEILPLTNFVFGEPERDLVARVKEALKLMGRFEYATVLPPQPEISEEEREELRGILADLGELPEEQAVHTDD